MRGKWFRLSVNRPYLISAEALVLAVAVHVLLFYLAGYEPEGMTDQQLDDLVPAFGL